MAILLCWLGCGKDNVKASEADVQIKSWHDMVHTLLENSARKDKIYHDTIVKLATKNGELLNDFSHKRDRVNIPDVLNHTQNDTIKQLAYIIQDADTIIQIDSTEIGMWKLRWQNEKEVGDTLRANIPLLEEFYNKKNKAVVSENRKLRLSNIILFMCSSVITAAYFLKP